MKLICQSYELLGTPRSLEEAWNFVARAARNCYQSTKSNPNESEEQFCRRLLLKHEDMECNHMSPFEFGVVYLTIPYSTVDEEATKYSSSGKKYIIERYGMNHYSRVKPDPSTQCDCVTTNLRVILEHGWEDDLKYAGPPTKYHMKACAFKMITNIGILGEIRTHESALSFTAESTRYCNYSKDKFGNELTFIQPYWLEYHEDDWNPFYHSLLQAEKDYLQLLTDGWSAQQAALVLPKATKTTVFMCGYEDSLRHVFRLRAEECSGPVHPQMAEIMKPMYQEYQTWLQNEKDIDNQD